MNVNLEKKRVSPFWRQFTHPTLTQQPRPSPKKEKGSKGVGEVATLREGGQQKRKAHVPLPTLTTRLPTLTYLFDHIDILGTRHFRPYFVE